MPRNNGHPKAGRGVATSRTSCPGEASRGASNRAFTSGASCVGPSACDADAASPSEGPGMVSGKAPRGGSRSARPPAVTAVITQQHLALLDPTVPEMEPVLEPLLQYRRRTFAPGGPAGYREAEASVTLFTFDVKDRLAFPAGLLPRVGRVLREHGYRVRVEDRRRDGPRLLVDEGFLRQSDADRPLREALVQHP